MMFVARETFNAISAVTRGGVFIRKRSPQPGSENPARRSALAPSNAVVPLRALEDISALFALEHLGPRALKGDASLRAARLPEPFLASARDRHDGGVKRLLLQRCARANIREARGRRIMNEREKSAILEHA
jgi:hypothetical protein